MALDFIEMLTVVIEQGGLAGAAFNIIDGMSNSTTENAVIFSSQTTFLGRNG
jgi:hypothetical protein